MVISYHICFNTIMGQSINITEHIFHIHNEMFTISYQFKLDTYFKK